VIDHSIGCCLFCYSCLDLSVICKCLVLVWIYLYVAISFVPLVGLVKLILYHVNFVITYLTLTKKNLAYDNLYISITLLFLHM
jgi:hypothetical protein